MFNKTLVSILIVASLGLNFAIGSFAFNTHKQLQILETNNQASINSIQSNLNEQLLNRAQNQKNLIAQEQQIDTNRSILKMQKLQTTNNKKNLVSLFNSELTKLRKDISKVNARDKEKLNATYNKEIAKIKHQYSIFYRNTNHGLEKHDRALDTLREAMNKLKENASLTRTQTVQGASLTYTNE